MQVIVVIKVSFCSLEHVLFFSFFFIAVTLCTDYTIHMLTQSLGKELFMLAGFLVWWQVIFKAKNELYPLFQLVCSSESRFTYSTFTLLLVICCAECFVTYRNIRNDQWMYQSSAVRPLALHCIGFPLVSIGASMTSLIIFIIIT